MKDAKITAEDFPLHKVVMTIDAAGKTSNNCFSVPYMQREATMYERKAETYNGEPLSSYMERSQGNARGELKIVASSYASCLEPIKIPARYNELPEIPGIDTEIELRNALVNELIREVTKRELRELFFYGDHTRRAGRGWLERLLSFFNPKYASYI